MPALGVFGTRCSSYFSIHNLNEEVIYQSEIRDDDMTPVYTKILFKNGEFKDDDRFKFNFWNKNTIKDDDYIGCFGMAFKELKENEPLHKHHDKLM